MLNGERVHLLGALPPLKGLTETDFSTRVSAAFSWDLFHDTGFKSQTALDIMKKGPVIFISILLAPIVLVSLVAVAAADWRQVGETGIGKVSVSSVRVLKNNVRTAWVRVEFKEPTKLPQGGTFVELRARVRFNCGNGREVPSAEWLYSRDHSGKLVVSKKTRRDDEFGQESEGGFGEIASKYVCGQAK